MLGVVVAITNGKNTAGRKLDHEIETPNTEFFMKQPPTMGNACSIIACLQVLMNNLHFVALEEDSVLDKMKMSINNKEEGEAPTPDQFLNSCTEAKEVH